MLLYPSDRGQTMADLVAYFGFSALFLLQMIPFILGLLGLVISAKYVHKTSPLTWFTSRNKIDINRIVFSFFLWALLVIIPTLIDWLLFPTTYTVQSGFLPFLETFFLLAVCLPFQVLFEELLFRGFIFQGLAKRTKSAIFAVIVSGIMFGMMHIGNPEVKSEGVGLLGIYIILGVSISLMAWLDQGIEIAFGFHLANNFITGILVTSEDQAFQTHALLKIESLNLSFGTILVLLLSILIFFVVCYKRFHWGSRFSLRNNH
jgi:membrane protease YdiL (CAAX protease family)